jgi:hypothetical protein
VLEWQMVHICTGLAASYEIFQQQYFNLLVQPDKDKQETEQ